MSRRSGRPRTARSSPAVVAGAACPDEITVGEILKLYSEAKMDEMISTEAVAHCIKALAPF